MKCKESTEDKVIFINDKVNSSSKVIINPALVNGTDFLSFFSALKSSSAGHTEVLLLFTSNSSRFIHQDLVLVDFYDSINLNFEKKLKSVCNIETNYVMNYDAIIYATHCIKTVTITIENDTCKLLLPNSLNQFLN